MPATWLVKNVQKSGAVRTTACLNTSKATGAWRIARRAVDDRFFLVEELPGQPVRRLRRETVQKQQHEVTQRARVDLHRFGDPAVGLRLLQIHRLEARVTFGYRFGTRRESVGHVERVRQIARRRIRLHAAEDADFLAGLREHFPHRRVLRRPGQILVDEPYAVARVVDAAMDRRPGRPRVQLAFVARDRSVGVGAAQNGREVRMGTLPRIPVDDSPRHFVQLVEHDRCRCRRPGLVHGHPSKALRACSKRLLPRAHGRWVSPAGRRAYVKLMLEFFRVFLMSGSTLGKRYKSFKSPFSMRGRVRDGRVGCQVREPSSRIGDFSGDSSVRGARIRGVFASHASAGQRGLSAEGVEPDGRGFAAGVRRAHPSFEAFATAHLVSTLAALAEIPARTSEKPMGADLF